MPWTSGDTEKAEDRIQRIGQTKTANIYQPQLGEIDKVVDALLQSKPKTVDIILSGKNITFESNKLAKLQKQITKYYEEKHEI